MSQWRVQALDSPLGLVLRLVVTSVQGLHLCLSAHPLWVLLPAEVQVQWVHQRNEFLALGLDAWWLTECPDPIKINISLSGL